MTWWMVTTYWYISIGCKIGKNGYDLHLGALGGGRDQKSNDCLILCLAVSTMLCVLLSSDLDSGEFNVIQVNQVYSG